jgi:hypothetical protein
MKEENKMKHLRKGINRFPDEQKHSLFGFLNLVAHKLS